MIICWILMDFDGLNFLSEVNILQKIIGLKSDKLIDILNYIKIIYYFSNAYIIYRIILTISVLIISVEKNYSKTKIINIYLRLIMSQQKLNKLILLSIKKVVKGN